MPTTTLRPDSLIASDLWTSFTLAAVSDNSDATFAYGSTPAFIRATLDDYILPTDALLKTVKVSVRTRGHSGAINGGAIVSLYDINGQLLTQVYSGGGASFATYASAEAIAPSPASTVNGLTLWLTLYHGAGGVVDVADIWVDVVHATPPSAAVTAPTGTVTTTTSPTVTWTYTAGSDGGVQTAYAVKVFSAAQYGAAGFSPDTSPADYSAAFYGANTSHQVGPLSSPTSFRAYVAVAQSINGALHWSDWDFVAFSTNVPGPEVDTISATADNANGRIRIVVTRDTGTLAWTMLDVERSDDAGVTWVPMRGATDVAPPGNMWIGYDYEPPNGAPVSYRARGSTALITGPWTSSSSVSWSSTSTWLKHLRLASLNRVVRLRVLPALDRGRDVGVFYPVGRADPVVISDVRRLTAGTLEITTTTEQQTTDVLELLESSVLLAQTPVAHGFGSRYVAIVGSAIEVRPMRTAQSWTRVWQVPFVEVLAPADEGVIVVGGTSYDDLGDQFATYTAWIASGQTYGDYI